MLRHFVPRNDERKIKPFEQLFSELLPQLEELELSRLQQYNKAKQYKELTLAALKNPKGPEAAELKAREEAAVAEQAARKEYERGVALANTEEKQKTLLTKLEAERQRLVDRGESTTDIDVQITNLKNKLKKTTAQRETVPGAKRPAGVPADAQWNPKKIGRAHV